VPLTSPAVVTQARPEAGGRAKRRHCSAPGQRYDRDQPQAAEAAPRGEGAGRDDDAPAIHEPDAERCSIL
jgi:hypothetical protein